MRLSRRLARFNRVVTNRVQGVWAPRLPPWAVLLHTGRRSGRAYRTPVMAFPAGDRLVVALLYGPDADWVQNLAAAPGQVVRAGHTYALVGPVRVTPTAATPELDDLSPLGRSYCRLATHQAVVGLGARVDR